MHAPARACVRTLKKQALEVSGLQPPPPLNPGTLPPLPAPPIPWQPDSRNKTVHLAKWPLSKMSDEHLAAAAAAAAASSAI